MIRETFLEMLGKVLPFVSKGDMVAQYSTVLLKDNSVIASDGYNSIQIEYDLGGEFNDLVPAETLYKLVKSIRAKEFSFVRGKGTIKIKTKSIIGSVNCMVDTVPPASNFVMKTKEALPDNFISCLKCCRFGVSTDQSLGCLVGVIIKNDMVYAIDRFSVVKAKLSSSLKRTVVFPLQLLNEIVKYEGKIKSFYLRHNKDGMDEIVFSIKGGIKILGALIEYDLNKDIEEMLINCKSDKKITLGTFPKSMREVLDRHAIILSGIEDIDRRIHLCFDGGGMEIKSVSDKGKITERIKMEGKTNKKAKIELFVNPMLLKDVLVYNPHIVVDPKTFLLNLKSDMFDYFVFAEQKNEEE
jgi:hypothetical protein